MLVNIALFGLWWSLIRVDAIPAGKIPAYQFTYVGIQITILAAIITFGALLIAGLSFIGYRSLVEKAENKADKVAREAINKYANLSRENSLFETVLSVEKKYKSENLDGAQEADD